ncbi:MAG: nucleotidyl transferase AbiEii/AbiGii toxin family protein [Candidatus Azambacteria bacterium]|nr:nucleotidyl transferase AbiEii/AbiGii toxin family protein [Candidatus Azambacteria bacterium]
MYKEILVKEQVELLPLIEKFIKDFGLVGGTAIALQIGHRRSIDFDLFSAEEFNNGKIRKMIIKSGRKIGKVYKDEIGQFTFFVNNVQLTFFHYPFKIEFSEHFEKTLRMPDLLTLAAMKAYTLGRRAKWKDYVDLYFIINKYHSINKIVKRSETIFKGEFNERIFREQLAYFKDIDYREEIDYLKGFDVSDKIIKKELINFSLE